MNIAQIEQDRIQSLLFDKVSPEPMSGCWLWTGAGSGNGYGVMRCGSGMIYAHRAFYAAFRGTIPHGLHIDHLCRTKRCVNPSHLEAVSVWQNVTRGLHGALKTTCAQGHPFIGGNIGISPKTGSSHGQRYCRVCKREAAERVRKALGAKP